MISLYIDNRLNDEHKSMVEAHFKICPKCYQKYKEIKMVVENIKLSTEKVLKKVEGVEAVSLFNIREYEKFYKNISAYIDNELTYNESVNFRKYLLQSKAARTEFRHACNLQSKVNECVTDCIEGSELDLSRKIVKEIMDEHKSKKFNFNILLKVAILIGLAVFSTSVIYFFAHSKTNFPPIFKQHKKVIYVENSLPQIKIPNLVSESYKD